MFVLDKSTTYVNRTKIYMANVLLEHLNFNTVHALRIIKPVMWGTYDLKYIWAKKLNKYIDYQLFVLLNVDNKTKKSMIPMLMKDKYYIDSYPYAFDKKDLIFVVFKIPKPLHKSYDNFILGNFSKMFTKQQLEKYQIHKLVDGKMNPLHAVLTKNTEFKKVFEEKIEREYGSVPNVDNDAEFDSFYVPPTYEAFNVDHYGPLPK